MRKLQTQWLRTIVLSTVIGLIGLAVQPVTAQDNERTYTIDENVLPKSVLEIVEVRNLNTENFPAALELVVKNVGDKPIYGIYVAAIFRGTNTGMNLYFGRHALAFDTGTPTAEDQPLRPGEKGILRVEPGIAKGTQSAITNGNLPVNQTLKLRFVFQTLGFGDGTGYQLTHQTGSPKS